MISRAKVSVYWPGIHSDIQKARDSCITCIKIAPSQSKETLILTPTPEWPFQCICMDLFEINHHVYIVCVDRYSGWPIIYHLPPGKATAATLISISRQIFIAYGAPDELSSDGGSIFTSSTYQTFLKNWDVTHRLSSAEYAQSNGRAELGVKSSKRIIYDNASPSGSIDNDKVARAILQYRNTPIAGINLSPAQLLLHRQLKDFMPGPPILYIPHEKWITAAKQRESAISKRNIKLIDRYNATAKDLVPLCVGDCVALQNRQKRWVRVGKIVEKLKDRQYRVRMEGSGRITLRNRRFMRKMDHLQVKQSLFSSPLNTNVKVLENQDTLVTTDTAVYDSPPSTVPGVPLALRRLNQFNKSGRLDFNPPTQRLRGRRGDVEI
jgi:hypothetical protein